MGKINPRVDLAFKKIFGTEENKDLLISLINSTVGEEDQVIDVVLLNPYNQKNFKQDKLSILDIKAKGTLREEISILKSRLQMKQTMTKERFTTGQSCTQSN